MTKPAAYVANTPIALAVEHLRVPAVLEARRLMEERIEKVLEGLAAANWDINAYAPYPSSRLGREEYKAQMRRRDFVKSITEYDQSHPGQSSRMNNPTYHKRNDEKIAHILTQVEEMTSASFEAFVAKLEAKTGPVKSAVNEGNTWGLSYLTVVTESGDTQLWKTQQIWNVSVLGLVFPQWPTRQVKSKK